MDEIDFSKGAYKGDDFEEYFKPFTAEYMEWWWQFREVLQASDRWSGIWKTLSDNKPLVDEDQQQLIAVSMLNHSVYLNISEALTFHNEMNLELHKILSPFRPFEVRKLWKASYSSLYTAFNSLANIVYVLVYKKPVTKTKTNGEISTQTAGTIKGELLKSPDSNFQKLGILLEDCLENLEIRTQLDHFWTMWMRIEQGGMLIDKDYKKGVIIVHPEKEAELKDDAVVLANSHIINVVKKFNEIYRLLALKKDGYLDQYLVHKHWYVDYGNFGFYDENRRPTSKDGK